MATAALVAAGCGSDDGDDGGSGGGNLAEQQELVVNMGEEAEPGQFVPAAQSYLDAVNSKGYVQFAGLYRIDGQDNEVIPHLATGAPEISDDGLTYTIEMRDDAMWSDGEPIEADDLVAAVQHALDPETGAYFASFLKSIVGACESLAGTDKEAMTACPEPRTSGKPEEIGVTAIDDHTVEIKLKEPVPWFDQLLTIQIFYPLRADQLEKLGDKYGEDPETAVSGPFKIESYAPGGEIVYVKNEEYFDADEVELEKLTFRTVAEPTTAAADFERGKLDTGLQNTMFDTAEIDKWKVDDRFLNVVTVGSQYMYINTSNPELSDPKVRQGIAQAINRSDITENITKKGDVPTNVVVPPSVPGFDVWGEGAQDFLAEDGAADVDKARDLLEEGGFDESETLTLYYATDSSSAGQTAEQIQANLAEVGVKVELKPTSGDVFSTEGIGISPTDAKVDLVLQGWIQDYLDAQDWYQLWYGKNIASGLNNSNYDSEEYDRIYEEAIKTVDPDARFELYKELEAKLTGPEGDMPAVPLYVQADATLVQPWVNDMELTPSGVIYWERISVNER